MRSERTRKEEIIKMWDVAHQRLQDSLTKRMQSLLQSGIVFYVRNDQGVNEKLTKDGFIPDQESN